MEPRGVLVCGLGRLGQHCVATLRELGAPVHGMDVRRRDDLDVPELHAMLASLTLGDCRVASKLEEAGIASCRAVLLVTGDERVNIAAAFAVRRVAPDVRLVVRSGQRKLNELLGQHLGNFVAFEPAIMSAPAFVLAALGGETRGLFRLQDEIVRVQQVTLTDAHAWRGRRFHELNTSHRRLLTRATVSAPWTRFYGWSPDERAAAGDVLTFVERGDDSAAPRGAEELAPAAAGPSKARSVAGALAQIWREAPQTARVAVSCAAAICTLLVSCAASYELVYPDVSLRDAVNVAVVLVLGGYDNLFGSLKLPFRIPPWLHVLSLLVSVSGTVGIGILYAFLTEHVLSARFQLIFRRPRVPRSRHVVLVGLGPLGVEIARLFRRLRRPLLAVSEAQPDAEVATLVPWVFGRAAEAFGRAHVPAARSVVALLDDDVANLECALVARAQNARCALVIRTDDVRFRENVSRLVPGSQALGVLALAAPAFAAAAFGEHIHELLHVDEQTVLVTEYRVEEGDTLCGRILSQVAYGFDVMPVFLRRLGGEPELFPGDDLRLHVGDVLIVLATVGGLRAIEQGEALAPSSRVLVDRAPTPEAAFEAANVMARVSGCEVATSRALADRLPALLELDLYPHQADRLVRELARVGVGARAEGATPAAR